MESQAHNSLMTVYDVSAVVFAKAQTVVTQVIALATNFPPLQLNLNNGEASNVICNCKTCASKPACLGLYDAKIAIFHEEYCSWLNLLYIMLGTVDRP